jgi:hypothetical protein
MLPSSKFLRHAVYVLAYAIIAYTVTRLQKEDIHRDRV